MKVTWIEEKENESYGLRLTVNKSRRLLL